MKYLKPAGFYAIAMALGAGLLLLPSGWWFPVAFLWSGEVFVRDFQYIGNPAGDGFRVGVNRLFFYFVLLTVVLLLVLTLWRATAKPFARFRKGVYLVLGIAWSVLPISTALVATVMVARLTVDMGVTPMRLLGIALGVACAMVFPLFLTLTMRTTAKNEPRVGNDYRSGDLHPSDLNGTSTHR
jgi:hypothetical protein